jgi:WSC domain
MACRGSNRELCGGPSRLNMYMYNGTFPNATTTTTTTAVTQPTSTSTGTQTTTSVAQPSSTFVHPVNYKGCFKEPGGIRALTNSVSVANSTNEACFTACSAAGYSVSGNEYGTECYCGNAFSAGTTSASESDCNMPCPGNSTEACGAGNRLSIYSNLANVTIQSPPTLPLTVGAYSRMGCWSDNQGNGRTLSALIPSLGKNNSLEACAKACSGYNYFGTEYGTECYCDDNLNQLQSNQSITDCSMVCPANSTEYCGAGNRLSLYKLTQVSSSSSTSMTSTTSTSTSTTSSSTSTTASTTTSSISSTSTLTSTTSTSTSTTTSTTSTTSSTSSTSSSTTTSSTITPTSISTTSSSTSSTTTTSTTSSSVSSVLPTGFKSLGCYQDTGSRSLSYNVFSNSSNTPALCASQCRQSGYRYSGVEYGNQCWCDNFILNAGSSAGSGQTGCTVTCAGDKTQTCGGSNRIQIYQDSNWQQSLFTIQAYNKWNYTDCLIDKPPPRTLNITMVNSNTQTVESCLQQCQAKNLPYCGVEYGNQCYGGTLTAANLTALTAPSQGSQDPLARGCNTPCKGNTTEACGGANRILVYAFNPNATTISPAAVQRSIS